MHVRRVIIKNFKAIRNATVELKPGLNIVVGDNETGKSTLLEAIHAAISGQIGGRNIWSQLHPFLFNQQASREYVDAFVAGKKPVPPEILVEVYFEKDKDLVRLEGSNNSRKEDCPGVSLRIHLDPECSEELAAYMTDAQGRPLIPVEFFEVEWLSFANQPMTARRMPFKSQLIDPASTDAQRGTGRYLSVVFGEHLTRKERIDLSLAYRAMKLEFERHPTVGKINGALATRRGELSQKSLSVAMDMVRSCDWDQGVVPLLDDIPFDLVGKGEQSAARIWLAVDGANSADIVMIEEPESHLSHARLNALISRIRDQIGNRQLIVTTHSSFVLNKLGVGDVLLFNTEENLRLTDLTPDTTDYFMRLPGHDTLRMVLAERVILVEGPSDELIVQRAFLDMHGRRPIEAGVDVLCVRSLAFKRFLDIGVALKKEVAVVTDNDGDTARMRARYAAYEGKPGVRICVSDDALGETLEPQLVAANDLATLTAVLGRAFPDKDAVTKWMLDNKTEVALAIHTCTTPINFPRYIQDAIQ